MNANNVTLEDIAPTNDEIEFITNLINQTTPEPIFGRDNYSYIKLETAIKLLREVAVKDLTLQGLNISLSYLQKLEVAHKLGFEFLP